MAKKVVLEIIFTEEEFELLSFEKQGEIIENMLVNRDWDIEIGKIHMN